MTNRRLSKFRLKLSLILLCLGPGAFILSLAFRQNLLVLVSLGVAVLGVAIGKNRLTCPKCGKSHLAIGADVRCCNHCGAPYSADFQENKTAA